ncbi:MAG: bifunctional pyr operon transcriptional regulator/uracil phosphoribosyltransferase PyrR [Bernardetiaceae bacterium]|nr:bifunctional pyr operon transcriptional regulator/uracil phosphoribosyltransferase PyrR [Bernardetiaceae bacterium]
MDKKLLLDTDLLSITISRLCQQLGEKYGDFENTVLIGMQPRGRYFAKRIAMRLKELFGYELPLGELDITFYRDDFRRRDEPLQANATHIPFIIEDKKVILIDDVLYSGRTINSAMSAMAAFGRPAAVELLVLINRKYSRHLPIEPNYVGKSVNTIQSQRIKVEWKEQGAVQDRIWLVSQPDA